jgi:ribosome-associated translation inhibitor RaiA
MEKVNSKSNNKNLTLVYQNLQPNLELKLFVSGQLTYLLEKCPSNSNLTAKITDLEDRYMVQLNLVTDKDLLFATGEDEVVAAALDTAVSELSEQMRFWNRGHVETAFDAELF